MKAIESDLPDVWIIEPDVFGDERGNFFESYNRAAFSNAVGRDVEFVQDNQSSSSRGVLRGLHYQLEPHAQGKLVRVNHGSVFDVAVDIRRSSPNFGKSFGIELSAKNRRQLWIPPGFAHGFLVLSDTADFIYKTTDYWFKNLERSIAWDCPRLSIVWPSLASPSLSDKDRSAPHLDNAEVFE